MEVIKALAEGKRVEYLTQNCAMDANEAGIPPERFFSEHNWRLKKDPELVNHSSESFPYEAQWVRCAKDEHAPGEAYRILTVDGDGIRAADCDGGITFYSWTSAAEELEWSRDRYVWIPMFTLT